MRALPGEVTRWKFGPQFKPFVYLNGLG